MSASLIPTPDTAALCSFCSKPEPAVHRLVAGSGVFICDECVDLSAQIIAESASSSAEESARRRSAYFDPPVEVALARLGGLVRTADRAESQMVSSVFRLREQGTDWTAIAAAAEMGAESIQARLERPEPSESE